MTLDPGSGAVRSGSGKMRKRNSKDSESEKKI